MFAGSSLSLFIAYTFAKLVRDIPSGSMAEGVAGWGSAAYLALFTVLLATMMLKTLGEK